jgi:hypothetical protein
LSRRGRLLAGASALALGAGAALLLRPRTPRPRRVLRVEPDEAELTRRFLLYFVSLPVTAGFFLEITSPVLALMIACRLRAAALSRGALAHPRSPRRPARRARRGAGVPRRRRGVSSAPGAPRAGSVFLGQSLLEPVALGNVQCLQRLEFLQGLSRERRAVAVSLQFGHDRALAVQMLFALGDAPAGEPGMLNEDGPVHAWANAGRGQRIGRRLAPPTLY